MDLGSGPPDDPYFPLAPFLRARVISPADPGRSLSYQYGLIDTGSDFLYMPLRDENALDLPVAFPSVEGEFIHHCVLEILSDAGTYRGDCYAAFRDDIYEDILLIGRESLSALGLDFSISMRNHRMSIDSSAQ